MTADLWTVFAAVLLPYVPYLLVGLYKNQRGLYDPNEPRASDRALEGWSARARAAESNSWEALAAYTAVSWIAHEAGAEGPLLTGLGVAWVVSRVLYCAAYVSGAGWLRIVSWFVGAGLLLARFAAAAFGG